jgi:peptidyl-tRNA hydrolase
MIKLYLVTRKDLKPGQQAAQLAHALADFARHNPEAFKDWYDMSMYIVCLAVENEQVLLELRDSLKQKEIEIFSFHEPDLCNQLTAISVNPQYYEQVKPLLAKLPLALKGVP